MIFAIIAVICMLASFGLSRGGLGFTNDAAPVGSFMLLASVLFFLIGILLIGVSIGTVIGTAIS